MTRRAHIAGLLTLVSVLGVSAGQNAPTPTQQPPTFKVEVNYVEVDAAVTDRDGNFVRDLKKEDFQILEDGKPQTITDFSLVDTPIELQRPLDASRPVEPDVKSNERPFDGRVYVMVLDELHTDPTRTQLAKKAARQFIEQQLGENDLMAVVATGGGPGQEFTSNKRLLLEATEQMIGRKLQSAIVNMTSMTTDYWSRRSPQDVEDLERAENARTTLGVLRDISDRFGAARGRRKAILFLSEGIDYDIYNPLRSNGYDPRRPTAAVRPWDFQPPEESPPPPPATFPMDAMAGANSAILIDTVRELAASATKSNVSIYAVDPRGLTAVGDEDITVRAYPDDKRLGIDRNSLQRELRLSQDSLRTLAELTGGFAVVNRNDFTSAYERVVQDNSSYYMLAYYPPSEKRDGRFHTIEVRVTRPGLSVRARGVYAAPSGKPAAPAQVAANGPSAEVRDVLDSPLPVSGLAMRVFAAPFKGVAPNASVLLGAELRGGNLELGPNDVVELSFLALDAQGKIRGGKTDRITLNLQPDTKARIAENGLRLLNRMDLAPGRYQIRFGARDSGGGALGSVLYDLDVPDFAKTRFSMSGLVLTSDAAQEQMTARPDEQLRDVLPGPPVGLRDFPQDDEITVFSEVYDNEASTPHKVDITTTVRTDEGTTLFKNTEERDSSEIQGKPGGYRYSTRIPLGDLPPGVYVLKVEARSSLGREITATREVQFTVGRSRARQFQGDRHDSVSPGGDSSGRIPPGRASD